MQIVSAVLGAFGMNDMGIGNESVSGQVSFRPRYAIRTSSLIYESFFCRHCISVHIGRPSNGLACVVFIVFQVFSVQV